MQIYVHFWYKTSFHVHYFNIIGHVAKIGPVFSQNTISQYFYIFTTVKSKAQMNKEEKIREFISVNLEMIHNAKNQSLHKSDFVDLEKNKLENPDELIGLMVQLDLIETESDDDFYFLTEIGYKHTEDNSGWYWGELPPEYYKVDDDYDDDDYQDEEFDPNPIPIIDNRKKEKRYFWLFLIIIIGVYYFLIYDGKPKENTLNIPPGLGKELQQISDSLRNSNPQDTLRIEVRDSH